MSEYGWGLTGTRLIDCPDCGRTHGDVQGACPGPPTSTTAGKPAGGAVGDEGAAQGSDEAGEVPIGAIVLWEGVEPVSLEGRRLTTDGVWEESPARNGRWYAAPRPTATADERMLARLLAAANKRVEELTTEPDLEPELAAALLVERAKVEELTRERDELQAIVDDGGEKWAAERERAERAVALVRHAWNEGFADGLTAGVGDDSDGGWEDSRARADLERLQAGEAGGREELWLEYVQLLCAELDDTIGLAAAHGWRSSRHKEGRRLRSLLNLDENNRPALAPMAAPTASTTTPTND